jgi:hypothetical protein
LHSFPSFARGYVGEIAANPKNKIVEKFGEKKRKEVRMYICDLPNKGFRTRARNVSVTEPSL